MYVDDPHTKPAVNSKAFDTVNTILVSLMMTCTAVTFGLLGERFIEAWNPVLLSAIAFFVAMERLTTFKLTKRMTVFTKSWLIFHLTQWVFFLIFLKVIFLLIEPPESLLIEFQLWQLNFFTNFLDMEYMAAAFFFAIIWLLTGLFAGLLNDMSLEEALIKYEIAVQSPDESVPPRERMLGLVFGIGFVLVIITAVMRVNLRLATVEGFNSLEIQPLPYLAAGAWNVLLYFVLGLGLMSQSQLAKLNARWFYQKIPVNQKLAGNWALYSFGFILIVGLFASFLPTNYSIGILSIISYVIRFIFGIAFFIFGVLGSIFAFLISQLFLFGGGADAGEAPKMPSFTPPEVPREINPSSSVPWLELAKSILFWSVFLLAVGFSIYQFMRQHEGIRAALRRFPGIKILQSVWQWLKGFFNGVNVRVRSAIESGVQKMRTRRTQGELDGNRRLLNHRLLNPRERIFFFYFAMIRRGGEKGLPREKAQTPYEYAATLENAIPDVENELGSLTDAFITARYSKDEIDDKGAGLAKNAWARIKGALRSIHRRD